MTKSLTPARWLSIALVAPVAAGGLALATLWASNNNPRQDVIDADTRVRVNDAIAQASSSVELSTLAAESFVHDRDITSLAARLDRVNAQLAALRQAPISATTAPARPTVSAPPAIDATTGAS